MYTVKKDVFTVLNKTNWITVPKMQNVWNMSKWVLIAIVPGFACLPLNSLLSTTAWLFWWESGPLVASAGPQSQLVCCSWRAWSGLQQLSAPSSHYCSDLCSAVHTWSTMTALHTGIFHFLFSVTRHSPAPQHHGPQTNGKTSGALQLQHAWYVSPAFMTLAVEKMESYWPSTVNKSHQF